MKISQLSLFLLSVFILLGASLSAQVNEAEINSNSSEFKLKISAEMGFLAVLSHKIQLSNSGTEIDYVEDGGQSNLLPFRRFSLEAQFNPKNSIVLLYQPIRIETQSLLKRDLVIDDLLFPQGTGVDFLYNFPFYRISYLREFLSENNKYSLAAGVSLQARNATITFASQDGLRFRRNSDVGPVPALKLRTRAMLGDKTFVELEADGIYAPISYLNGSTNEIVGAILDASIRTGYQLRPNLDSYFNLRYIGGGAVGTSSDLTGPGDGYVRNWLHFMTVSCGFTYEF